MRLLGLIDRITELDKGRSISAVKCLTLAEEYLQDHFPRFPVMPGVMMLESLYQAASWLVRVSNDFRYSMVFLRECRNVKYAGFVVPGETLTVRAQIRRTEERLTWIDAEGSVEDRVTVKARLALSTYNLCEDDARQSPIDAYVRKEMLKQFRLLCSPDLAKEVIAE